MKQCSKYDRDDFVQGLLSGKAAAASLGAGTWGHTEDLLLAWDPAQC